MLKKIMMLLTMFVVSMFYFPINFTFIPGPNTKTLMAGLGIVICLFNLVRRKTNRIPKNVLILCMLAGVVSLIALSSITYNKTHDTAYATYIVSAAVWLSASFVACLLIKRVHGYIDIGLITNYLMAVCVYQCIAALLIDNIPTVRLFVDTYISQGQSLLREMDRLYGIGASLDTAGTRFSAVLILIVGHIINEKERRSLLWSSLYILLFLFICVIGSMIARTTYVGIILSVLLAVFSIISSGMNVSIKSFGIFSIICIIAFALVSVCIHLYNTNDRFYENMRFAFEGFFNLAEKGEYTVSSNEKLKTMYVWPDNTKTWVIGDGYFSNPRNDINYLGHSTVEGFYMGTDVGYCRFVFYFGLVGLLAFSVFLCYCASAAAKDQRRWRMSILMILAANFVIWLKVASDLFLVFAMLICVTDMQDNPKKIGDRFESTWH